MRLGFVTGLMALMAGLGLRMYDTLGGSGLGRAGMAAMMAAVLATMAGFNAFAVGYRGGHLGMLARLMRLVGTTLPEKPMGMLASVLAVYALGTMTKAVRVMRDIAADKYVALNSKCPMPSLTSPPR